MPTLFKNHDLFVLTLVVSEVFNLDQIEPIMGRMVQGCGKDSRFLFIDRYEEGVIKKVHTLIEKLGLKIEHRDTTRRNMDLDEQKDVVRGISEVLQRDPKVQWNAFWILAVKP